MGRHLLLQRRALRFAYPSRESHQDIQVGLPRVLAAVRDPRHLHRCASGALLMRAYAALLLLALSLAAGPAGANSILSIGGLGEPQLEEPARLRALGGAGAA